MGLMLPCAGVNTAVEVVCRVGGESAIRRGSWKAGVGQLDKS